MKVQQFVFVRFEFEGFHRWKDAPDVVGFLRDRHRHVFHVEAKARVNHDDRDREFILMKRELEAWCLLQPNHDGPSKTSTHSTVLWSCERWAIEMLGAFPFLVEVSVSEDGENGAIVIAEDR